MPSKSGKQHRFMEMVAHDPAAAKRVGVPASVGKEFVAADKGKAFSPRKHATSAGREVERRLNAKDKARP